MASASPTPFHLPLPVARLARRSRNAKSARERHDNAWYAFEVSVRLAVAAAPPPRPGELARASFGQWAACLERSGLSLEAPAIRRLHSFLAGIGFGRTPGSPSSRVSGQVFLAALAAYRNRVLGHGATRPRSFYARAAELLAAALEPAWEAGLFLPPASRLVWIGSVEMTPDGQRRAWLLDLTSEMPMCLPDDAGEAPEGACPGRVLLQRPGSWRDLHPWLLYDEEEERLYCFNGLVRGLQYLDFAGGHCLRGGDLESRFPGAAEAMKALLQAPPPASSEATPTPSILGEFRILGLLGRGGMGEVHLARQQSLGRLVALKTLPSDQLPDQEAVLRFQREIQALSRCEHPNVVKILACGSREGRLYYAMEMVEGVDLASVCDARRQGLSLPDALAEAARRRRQRLAPMAVLAPELAQEPEPPPPEGAARLAARLFREAALGTAHLHANGVRHRDLKPGNVMVTCEGRRAVIMDLGLAAVADATFALTRAGGGVLGTLRYVAPEVLEDGTVDAVRCDIFSLGATFWELLAGRPLRQADSENDLVQAILRGTPPPLRRAAPWVPGDLARIIEKATSRDPALRYSDARALAADLEAFLEDRPVQARGPSPLYRLRLHLRRNRRVVQVAAAALLLLAGAGAWFLDTATSERARRERLGAATASAIDAQLERVEDALLRAPEPSLRGRLRGDLALVASLRRSLENAAAGDTRLLAARAIRLEGDLLRAMDRQREAAVHWALARNGLASLPADAPGVASETVRIHLRLAEAARLAARPEEGRRELARARDILDGLPRTPGGARDAAPDQARLRSALLEESARQALEAGRAREAVDRGREAVELRRRTLEQASRDAEARHALTVSLLSLGQVLLQEGPTGAPDAASLAREAAGLCRTALEGDPGDRRASLELALAVGLAAHANRLAAPEDPETLARAVAGLGEALDLGLALLAEEPDWPWAARQQSLLHAWLAEACRSRQGELPAIEELRKAMEWARRAARARPGSPRLAGDAAEASLALARACLSVQELGVAGLACEEAERALAPFTGRLTASPRLLQTWIGVQVAGIHLRMLSDPPAPAAAHARACAILEKAGFLPGNLATCREWVLPALLEPIEGTWKPPALAETAGLRGREALVFARVYLARGHDRAELASLLRAAGEAGPMEEIWLDAGLLVARACAARARAAPDPQEQAVLLERGREALARWIDACSRERERLRGWLGMAGAVAAREAQGDVRAQIRWLEQRLADARDADSALDPLRGGADFAALFARP